MERFIGTKRYNTATARRLVQWANYPASEVGRRDYERESLYLKKTGECFLHEEGNAGTRHASVAGGLRTWGERIVPVSHAEAEQWLEKRFPGTRWEELLAQQGSPAQAAGRINMALSPLERELALRHGARFGITGLQDAVRDAILAVSAPSPFAVQVTRSGLDGPFTMRTTGWFYPIISPAVVARHFIARQGEAELIAEDEGGTLSAYCIDLATRPNAPDELPTWGMSARSDIRVIELRRL